MPFVEGTIKVNVDGKWRRLALDVFFVEFEEVLKAVSTELDDVEELYYYDDEDDECYIYNEKDWQEAISVHKSMGNQSRKSMVYLKVFLKTKSQSKEVPLEAEGDGCCGGGSRGKPGCSEEDLDQVWSKLIQMIKSYALFLPPEVGSIVNSDKLDELKESQEAKKFLRRFANVGQITPMTLLASLHSEDFKAFMTKVKSLFADVCNDADAQADSTRSCPVVHVGVECDGCQQNPIRGPRFKCQDCPNFDFCFNCRFKADHDSSHSFDTIEAPRFPFGIYRRQHPCPWPSSEAQSTPTKTEETSAKPETHEIKKQEAKKESMEEAKETTPPPEAEVQDQPKSDEEFEVVQPSPEPAEFEKELRLLKEMGFTNEKKNLELLRAMDGDLKNVLQALFQN